MNSNQPAVKDPETMTRDELVAEVKMSRKRMPIAFRGIRKQSKATLFGLPLVSIASGPDFEKGEWKGHAKGIIAIGDFATGVIAIGGIARGIFAFGGLALGLVSIGGLVIGGLALGGCAVGAVAVGGVALGAVAVGGLAIGHYALGGDAFGTHVINAINRSPEAVQFFERFLPENTIRQFTK